MNTEPFNADTLAAADALNELANLPTRDEVIKLLARERTRIAAVYDADTGEQVHLDGRQAGSVSGKSGGVVRCAICDAPAGEVTVERVKVLTPEVFAIAQAAGLPTEGYVCLGGDCAGQRNKRIQKLWTVSGRALVRRLTDQGRVMGWNHKGEYSYELTSREVSRRKSMRRQQAQSRRANRSK